MCAGQCRSVMARCDVVLLASSVWRLAPQESVQRTVGSVKGAEGAELKESARERTAVKPPTPFDAQAECKRHAWVEGGAESEASGPKAAALGKRDGQRTKEQRGARTPAHAKVGGAMVLAGQACCRFSRFIRPIPLIQLSLVRCSSPRRDSRRLGEAAGKPAEGGRPGRWSLERCGSLGE